MKWQCLVIKFQFWETYDQAVPHIELFLGFVVFFAFFFLCVCVCVWFACLFVFLRTGRPTFSTQRDEKKIILGWLYREVHLFYSDMIFTSGKGHRMTLTLAIFFWLLVMLASCSSECKDLNGFTFCQHYKGLCATNISIKRACQKTCGLCKCW